MLDAGDGFLGAGFEAHLAVAARAAADAAGVVVGGVAEVAVVAAFEVGGRQLLGRDFLFLGERLGRAVQVLVGVPRGFAAAADGVREAAGLDRVAGREDAWEDGLLLVRDEPALAEVVDALVGEGRRLLHVDGDDGLGAHVIRAAARVHAGVAGADDDDVLARRFPVHLSHRRQLPSRQSRV